MTTIQQAAVIIDRHAIQADGIRIAHALADAGLLSDTYSRDVLTAELAVIEAAKNWRLNQQSPGAYIRLRDEVDALYKAEAEA